MDSRHLGGANWDSRHLGGSRMRFHLPFRFQHLDQRGDDGIAFAHLNLFVIGIERLQRDLLVMPRSVFVKGLLARILLNGICAARFRMLSYQQALGV